MAFFPSSTHQLLEVCAWVNGLVIWGQVIQDFGGSMDTFWSQTEVFVIQCLPVDDSPA
jgi:hypothetical protein